MKKFILFIAAGIIVFCIVPIATTQAMPQRIQRDNSFASNNVLYVLNQKELRNMNMELNNPEIKDNILTPDVQELRGETIARRGTRPVRPGNKNPYVKRRGYGSSDYDNESERDVDDEDEVPDDNSAVDFNEGLEDSSGYNEDL